MPETESGAPPPAGGAAFVYVAAHARDPLTGSSFNDLYQELERSRQSVAPDELQALLEARIDALRECGQEPARPSAEARAALAKPVTWHGATVQADELQRELSVAISERFALDEVRALVLLRTFLESEHRTLELLTRGKRSGERWSEFLDAVNVFYFEERLACVRCVSALLRIAEDVENALYDVAVRVLDRFADAELATRCLTWTERYAGAELPANVADDPRYSLLWARQGVLMQLSLLEVAFLLYYGRLGGSGSWALQVLQLAQRTQFGLRQANAGYLDVEHAPLLECVQHAQLLLALEALDLEGALDAAGAPGGAALPAVAQDAGALEQVLEMLEQGAGQSAFAPVLLGWALVLRRVDEALENDAGGADAARLAAALRVEDGGAAIWQRLVLGAFNASMDVLGVLHTLLASPLLAQRTSAVLGATNLSTLAYRAVFKGVLLSITELVQPAYLDDYDALLALWERTFSEAGDGAAALCTQFWAADAPHASRAAVLDTARRRFPVSFTPLVRLGKALGGHGAGTPEAAAAPEACSAVLDYIAALPTLALLLPPQRGTGLRRYELAEEPGAQALQYRLLAPLRVPGTRVTVPRGARGTLVSPLGEAPAVVLWHLPAPISGWRLLRDVLAALLAPPTHVRDEQVFGERGAPESVALLSPELANAAEAAAEVLELFAAVLADDERLASTLCEHLAGAEPDAEDAGCAPPLAALAQSALHAALTARPLNGRLACAAYRVLTQLVRVAPNDVWQRVRSSNALVGSPGTVPLAESLRAQRPAPGASVLLADATARAQYDALLCLLDLLEALLHDALAGQFADVEELAALKASVLARSLAWLAEAVWAEHATWRYALGEERLVLGSRCVRLFDALLADPAIWAPQLETPWAPRVAPLRALVERVFVVPSSVLALAPVLGALGGGHAVLDEQMRAGDTRGTRAAEGLIEQCLRFARHAIERHMDVCGAAPRTSVHLLETLFFSHTPVAGARQELAGAVLAYIWRRAPPALGTEAARLVATVSRSTSAATRAEASQFRLAGHLGSALELEAALAALRGVLANPHEDQELCRAVWALLGALVEGQPALATLLLTGRPEGGARDGKPPERTDGKPADGQPRTPLQLAVQSVARHGPALWDDAPALLDMQLCFLHVAWAHALEHASVFSALHEHKPLWEVLAGLVQRTPEAPTALAGADESASDGALPPASLEVATAFRISCQARALRLLHTAVLAAPPQKPAGSLGTLLTLTSGDALEPALSAAFAELSTAPPQALEERTVLLAPQVPLAAVRLPVRQDELDLRRTFGPGYVYDLEALREKAAGAEADPEADAQTTEAATEAAAAANLLWSTIDARAARARAWTEALAQCTGRLLHHAEQRGAEALRALQAACGAAFVAVARIAAGTDGEAQAHADRLALLCVLLAAAWADVGGKAGAAASPSPPLDPAVPLVAALVEHSAFPLQASLEGRVAPAYHTSLFQLMLVCAVRCRHERAALPPSVPRALGVLATQAMRALGALDALVRLAGEADAPAAAPAEAQLAVLAALVHHLVHARLPLDPSVWLGAMHRARTLPACAELLTRAPLVALGPGGGEPGRPGGAPAHVRFLTPLLQLFDTLAAHKASCEAVALSGVMYALCSTALSARLEGGELQARLASGEPNPLHEHWMLALQLATRLVEHLPPGAAARFVDTDVEAFAAMYAAQLERSLRFAPAGASAARDPPAWGAQAESNAYQAAPPLDAAQLEEVAAVVRLFYAMHRAKAAVRADGTVRVPLGAALRTHAPALLQQLAYLEQHPHELRALLGLAEVPETERREADALAHVAHEALRDACATLLALLWDMSGAAPVLCSDDAGDWPRLPALIRPSLHAAPDQPASLGTLLELATTLSDALAHEPAARRAGTRAALQQSIALCITQAAVWTHGALPHGADPALCALVDQAHAEVDAGLLRDIEAAIRVADDASARGADGKREPIWGVLRGFAGRYLRVSE